MGVCVCIFFPPSHCIPPWKKKKRCVDTRSIIKTSRMSAITRFSSSSSFASTAGIGPPLVCCVLLSSRYCGEQFQQLTGGILGSFRSTRRHCVLQRWRCPASREPHSFICSSISRRREKKIFFFLFFWSAASCGSRRRGRRENTIN